MRTVSPAARLGIRIGNPRGVRGSPAREAAPVPDRPEEITTTTPRALAIKLIMRKRCVCVCVCVSNQRIMQPMLILLDACIL